MSTDGEKLEQILKLELLNIPIQSWGHFFPALVASWRYLQKMRPGMLGEVSCGYNNEPWFKGDGAEIFGKVINHDEVLASCERVMYPLAKSLSKDALRAGRLIRESEIPEMDPRCLEELAQTLLRVADQARNQA